MPQHKQFKKAMRVNARARLRNKSATSRMNSFIKKVRTAESRDEALERFRTAASIIDGTAQKGIIKKQTAARTKSRLSKFIATLP